jgi:hypothetical protein
VARGLHAALEVEAAENKAKALAEKAAQKEAARAQEAARKSE